MSLQPTSKSDRIAELGHSPQAIYFDLGNVLLTFDHLRACEQMAAAAAVSKAQVHDCLFESHGLQSAYERGELTSEEFCNEFRQRLDAVVEDEALLLAGSDMFALNTPMMPIVSQLEALGYDLGILSNTCEAHWEFVNDGKYDLFDRFQGPTVLSYEVCSMKPDPKIYQAAIEAVDCEPSRIFFMDDKPENVEGAHAAGLDAVVFTTAEQLVKELAKRGIELDP
ncbi:MAG: HAD family phosphatase [Planctomycetaceae bacterium]|nr:HAD family phosphatase [Planctomycetaceae bacterium]